MTTSGPWSEARARCDAATPGPWITDVGHVIAPHQDQGVSFAFDGDIYGDNHDADATFIAHARTDLPAALDAIDAVLALHQKRTGLVHLECDHCSMVAGRSRAWPCPTAAALGVTE